MVFDYTNGFHDAANAIATSVSTRALTPRIALIVAAFGNLVGSYFGKGVAETVRKDLVTLPVGRASRSLLFAAVIGAIAWNLITFYTGGFQGNKTHIPWWVFLTSATVLALGTYSGGWRIIRTLGRRVIHLGPAEGFSAETVASAVLFFNSQFLHAPISTTHTITSAIMGVGATKRLSAVRWGVAGNIVAAWVMTFPGAAAIAIVVSFLVRPLFGQ